MPDSNSIDYEPGVLRVLQTKAETKAFYNKIAKVYDLLSEHSERGETETGETGVRAHLVIRPILLLTKCALTPCPH
jgi:hypothetical protein